MIDYGPCLPPAAFQAAEQASFDLGRDVAVGLDDPVVEPVPEPPGLGDLGNAVSDNPRLVTVPKTMSLSWSSR
jgi:hypothetical protein